MFFQWYLFIWIFVVGVIANAGNLFNIEKINGKQEKRYDWTAAMLIAVPLIYLAGTRENLSFGDTSSYRSWFLNMPSSLSEVAGYLSETSKDKGFTYLSVAIKMIIGNHDVIYFTIIAAFCILCVVYVYRKYSINFVISMFLFVASADYIQWNYNGMRQFIAVAAVFACCGLLQKKKYIPAIIVICLAATVHATALLMLPIIFMVQGEALNFKTFIMVFAVIFSIAFIDRFTNVLTNFMSNSQYSNEVDQYLSTEGTNMLRVLVYSVPAILAFVFKSRIRKAHDPVINIAANMSVACAATYLLSAFTSGIFIGRIPIYFSLYNYILLPWIIENVFTKQSSHLIYVLMSILYIGFYYFQVVISWGL